MKHHEASETYHTIIVTSTNEGQGSTGAFSLQSATVRTAVCTHLNRCLVGRRRKIRAAGLNVQIMPVCGSLVTQFLSLHHILSQYVLSARTCPLPPASNCCINTILTFSIVRNRLLPHTLPPQHFKDESSIGKMDAVSPWGNI